MVHDIIFGIFGLLVLMSIAFLFSNNKSKVNWKLVVTGIGLQLFFAVIVLLTPWGSKIFDAISDVFVIVINFTYQGTKFVFGDLGDISKSGFIFALMDITGFG